MASALDRRSRLQRSAVFIVTNLAVGHLLDPNDAQERTTLAMESGARNFASVVATGALYFSQENALPVFIPYTIMFVGISMTYLKWCKNAATGAEVV